MREGGGRDNTTVHLRPSTLLSPWVLEGEQKVATWSECTYNTGVLPVKEIPGIPLSPEVIHVGRGGAAAGGRQVQLQFINKVDLNCTPA